jgi:N-acyl-D-amino-acid deacylase
MMNRSSRTARFGAAAAALVALSTLAGSTSAAQTDRATLLQGARVIDGSGNPGFDGDVLVAGGRIVAVGPTGTLAVPAGAVVENLTGLVLAPGFIDIHNHSTDRLAGDPAARTQVAQGVTTIVVGADGSSPWPIGGYLDELDGHGLALQVATLVGHGTVRRAAMGEDYRRLATTAELADMSRRVERGMEEGAFGLSSGLEYDPGFYSDTDELIALARIAAAADGFYMSHMRDEEEGVLDAVAEAIRIGSDANIPVQISHIKAGNASVWGKSTDILALIENARAAGVDVLADQYPYTAWQSGLGIVVRSRQFQDPDAVRAGLEAIGGGNRLQIVGYEPDPSVNGMRLDEAAAAWSMSEVDAYMDMMAKGGSGVIGHTMSEDDVDRFMASEFVMTASDGGIGSAHPRGAGAFARVLGHYVRERGVITLERAVQRGAAMPAARLGLNDRGMIAPGRRADLVAFDAATIHARSTFRYSLRQAEGVHCTWVAGVVVWADGESTGASPGGALRRPPR